MFEEQLNDAVQLVKNPDHEPDYIIPLEEMHRIEIEAKIKHEKSINQFLEKGAVYFFEWCSVVRNCLCHYWGIE